MRSSGFGPRREADRERGPEDGRARVPGGVVGVDEEAVAVPFPKREHGLPRRRVGYGHEPPAAPSMLLQSQKPTASRSRRTAQPHRTRPPPIGPTTRGRGLVGRGAVRSETAPRRSGSCSPPRSSAWRGSSGRRVGVEVVVVPAVEQALVGRLQTDRAAPAARGPRRARRAHRRRRSRGPRRRRCSGNCRWRSGAWLRPAEQVHGLVRLDGRVDAAPAWPRSTRATMPGCPSPLFALSWDGLSSGFTVARPQNR